ncbi:DegT/DnrJ/EryC1/StrS aminotransferase family protein [Flavivirga sp. 57AJ16]|uniref:DegT/DnrJ/EryC1/StrS family aminotransferase n=1 Tax=Flavivirga sp. 57AJ16 TaxID=3025307 RepID=UPI0023655546|nr:DegT/DnrJ/EryC1/StrS family aminotransferase [Flavivirga sp. 57AJ16]MDD7885342.1 DegT/DnrJ/EryC1/StrS family aminotransferase [Flavivirga sp. 57AJ16]
MIKFLDLRSINKRFDEVFRKKFNDFLNSGKYILDEQVLAFEKEYAAYCGVKYCIGVGNGLDAIKLILKAYKMLGVLNDGDEIIVPANTYIASVLAVSNLGFRPVLVEPDMTTYNINSEEVVKAITSKTKAILGVHLYGRLYNIEQLEKISKKYNLLLVEDAAQAHGATFSDGRKSGNVSDAAAFSFYPTKNLGALGDAGAITTNNKVLADVVFKLRNYGRVSTYKNDLKGYNCRLDELQATFLRIKLKYLDSDNNKRRTIAQCYFDNIDSSNVILPFLEDINQHVFHLFVIRSKKRDQLKDYLHKKGVETFIHYPIPIHKQPAYKEYKDCRFSVTEQIHKEILSLPNNPILTQEEVKSIISIINQY